MPETAARPVVQMINLGCAKNVVDSEEMLGVLSGRGYLPDGASGRADVVVINTCGFIQAAKQESIDVILEAVERKKRGDVGRVVVAGCLAQRYGAQLAIEIPEVDAFLGTGRMAEIADVVEALGPNGDSAAKTPRTPREDSGPGTCSSAPQLLGSSADLVTRSPAHPLTRSAVLLRIPEKPHHRWLDVPTRVRSTAPWTAYLKISEGCNHRCTFCAIPSFRGPHVSKPLDRVIAEAGDLAAQGVRELNLIAQDSTQYGYDLCGKSMLPELLKELSQVEGIRWIRLFYCYPSRVNARIIEAIAGTRKVCQYIDMPLQHADSGVLRAMRRPLDAAAYLRILSRFRAASPDVAIRTTFIVGFPGETEAAFNNLLRFVEEAQFDRVGVFEYSTEDGTPSASLPNRVPARAKCSRRDRLMRLQQQISLARNRAWVGRDIEVLVEQAEPDTKASGRIPPPASLETQRHGERRERNLDSDSGLGVFASLREVPLLTPNAQRPTPPVVGRTFRDGPEVDGQIFVAGTNAKPGEFIMARVTAAREYDLEGCRV